MGLTGAPSSLLCIIMNFPDPTDRSQVEDRETSEYRATSTTLILSVMECIIQF